MGNCCVVKQLIKQTHELHYIVTSRQMSLIPYRQKGHQNELAVDRAGGWLGCCTALWLYFQSPNVFHLLFWAFLFTAKSSGTNRLLDSRAQTDFTPQSVLNVCFLNVVHTAWADPLYMYARFANKDYIYKYLRIIHEIKMFPCWVNIQEH